MTKSAPAAPEPNGDVDHRILRVAARLFRERGFRATTVREVARAAEILPGSLHYRFASKEDLLLALMELGVARARSAVQVAIATSDDPIERLRLGLRAHLELLLSGEDAVYVLLHEWRSLRGESLRRMVALRDAYEAEWDALLSAALASGCGRPGVDIGLVRLLGFGAVNWVAQWFRPDGPRSAAEIADAFFAIFAFGLLDERARPSDVGAVFSALSGGDPPRDAGEVSEGSP